MSLIMKTLSMIINKFQYSKKLVKIVTNFITYNVFWLTNFIIKNHCVFLFKMNL